MSTMPPISSFGSAPLIPFNSPPAFPPPTPPLQPPPPLPAVEPVTQILVRHDFPAAGALPKPIFSGLVPQRRRADNPAVLHCVNARRGKLMLAMPTSGWQFPAASRRNLPHSI